MRTTRMAQSLAAQYSRFAEVAGTSIVGGWILPPFRSSKANNINNVENTCRVMVKRSHKDCIANKSRASLQTYTYNLNTGEWNGSAPSSIALDSTVISAIPSPSGKYTFILRKESSGGGGGDTSGGAGAGAKCKTICELWSESGALLRTVVSDVLHGDPLADGWFGSLSLSWSPDERFVCYVAESLAPFLANKSHFDSLLASNNNNNNNNSSSSNHTSTSTSSSSASASFGTQFDYDDTGGREDWGEKYVGVRCPRLFVCDFEQGKLIPITTSLPPNVCAGQPVWAPKNNENMSKYWLVYTGWTVGARRLGMIYCYQRPCALYAVDVTSALGVAAPSVLGGGGRKAIGSSTLQHYCLTPEEPISRSPRFSPNGESIAYLGMTGVSRYTHNGTSTLRVFDWKQWSKDLEKAKVELEKQHQGEEAEVEKSISSTTTITTIDSSLLSSSSTLTNATMMAAPNTCVIASPSRAPMLTTLGAIRSPSIMTMNSSSSGITNTNTSSSAAAIDSYLELPPPAASANNASTGAGAVGTTSSSAEEAVTAVAATTVYASEASNSMSGIGALSDMRGTSRPLQPPLMKFSLNDDNDSSKNVTAASAASTCREEVSPYSRLVIDEVWNPWEKASATSSSSSSSVSSGNSSTPQPPHRPSWFPGVHTHSLPSQCWAPDNRTLWFTSLSGSRSVIYRVDILTNDVFCEIEASELLVGYDGSTSSIGGDSADISASVFAVRSFGNYDTSQQQQQQQQEQKNVSSVGNTSTSSKRGGGPILLLAHVSCPAVPDQIGLLNCDEGPSSSYLSLTSALQKTSNNVTQQEVDTQQQQHEKQQELWVPNWWMSSAPPTLPSVEDWPPPSASLASQCHENSGDNAEINESSSAVATDDSSSSSESPPDLSLSYAITSVTSALTSLRWIVFTCNPHPAATTTISSITNPNHDNNNNNNNNNNSNTHRSTTDIPFEAILLYSTAANTTTRTTRTTTTAPPQKPLMLVPHGGPHSCLNTAFYLPYAYIASLGTAVLFVNYRGSTGFGQASIASLPGACGVNDVSDCMQAVATVLGATDVPMNSEQGAVFAKILADCSKSSSGSGSSGSTASASMLLREKLRNSTTNAVLPFTIDPTKLSVSGGSHGGFLTAHLIGQFPSVFKVACLRNPVINIASMVTATDIPDWCFTEAKGVGAWPLPVRVPFAVLLEKEESSSEKKKKTSSSSGGAGKEGGVILSLSKTKTNSGGGILITLETASPYMDRDYAIQTSAIVGHMIQYSPIEHVGKVANTTAILLLLGLKDRRVPASQGVEYYHSIRSRRLNDGSGSGSGSGGSGESTVKESLRLLSYPEDTHALDKPATEGDSWVNIAAWLDAKKCLR